MRDEVSFRSGGDECAAWLYRPPAGASSPCVVLGHGWSGVREQRLDAYAERFAAAGLAALVFDYRHFGASGGQPRQLLDIGRQHEDWHAAIGFARGLDGVDPDRVALWGTSFGGGHVMSVAAADPRTAAVVAQVPFADGLRNLPHLGLRHALVLVREGLRDQIAAALGRPPHMIPSVGPPGSVAVMTTPDADPGFHALDPAVSTWRNETAARVCLAVAGYRPIRRAAHIACPILFQIAADDAITPPQYAEAAARHAPRSEVRRYAGAGHFDPYVGELFERVVSDQIAFLARHLQSAATEGRAPLFARPAPDAERAGRDARV
ncbi:MAG: alpha/beta hydrolase [Thermoleophilaceae bacterium]